MSAFGGRVAFDFIGFTQRGSNPRLLIRAACVGGSRVANSGVKYVFDRQVRMSSVDIKHSVFVFALLNKGQVFGRINVFLYEFRYDSFDTGIKTGLLTQCGEKL